MYKRRKKSFEIRKVAKQDSCPSHSVVTRDCLKWGKEGRKRDWLKGNLESDRKTAGRGGEIDLQH